LLIISGVRQKKAYKIDPTGVDRMLSEAGISHSLGVNPKKELTLDAKRLAAISNFEASVKQKAVENTNCSVRSTHKNISDERFDETRTLELTNHSNNDTAMLKVIETNIKAIPELTFINTLNVRDNEISVTFGVNLPTEIKDMTQKILDRR